MTAIRHNESQFSQWASYLKSVGKYNYITIFLLRYYQFTYITKYYIYIYNYKTIFYIIYNTLCILLNIYIY